MSVAVITPPSTILTVTDARNAGVFTTDDVDTAIDVCIAAAQGTIDGPTGWLGRSVGLQTLEATFQEWNGSDCIDLRRPIVLPYPPIRMIVSVSAGPDGAVLDPSTYALANDKLIFSSAPSWDYPVTVRYQAGYSTGTPGLTDVPLPAPIRHAILLMAAQIKDAVGQGQVIREDVTGVGSTLYAMPAATAKTLQDTAEALLSTFRKFR